MENCKKIQNFRQLKEINKFYDDAQNQAVTPKKETFYVFLDIDGTLWDARYTSKRYGRYYYEYVTDPILKSESIEAVNLLLSSLEKKYDVSLVITSERRKHLETCINYLKENQLDFSKPIFAIHYPTKISRGQDIVDYLNNKGELKHKQSSQKNRILRFIYKIKNSEFKNYVVLEDEKKLVKDCIPRNRIILTDHTYESLTHEQIFKFLKKLGVEPVEIKEIKSPSIFDQYQF